MRSATGQPLIELDPADYKVAFDKAKAALEGDEADLKAAEIMVPPVNVQTSSQIEAAEAVLKAAADSENQARHNLEQLKDNRAAAAADSGPGTARLQTLRNSFGFRRRDAAPERRGANH